MSASGGPPYISAAEVARLVTMKDVIQVVGNSLIQFSAGEGKGGVVQPVRTVIPVKDHEGYLLTMPAYSQQSGSLAVKLVTLYSNNAAKGLPSHQGSVLLFDAPTGSVQAVIDAEHLTSMRTAAASACAVKALVPSPPEVLCVVGTGHEARTHLQACMAVHQYKEIRVWGRNKQNAQKCIEDVGGGCVVFESLEDAVRGADVIVTVTLSKEPIVHGRWVKTGAVLCCVGACRPDWRELDDEFMQNAVVTVDSREAASKEAGDIILSKAEVYAEIGEIMSGTKQAPKVPDCGKSYFMFKSLGMAVEDAVTAKLVYDKYAESKK